MFRMKAMKVSGIWWYLIADAIRLWLISPNAFFKSRSDITIVRWWSLASRSKYVSWLVCSATPSTEGQNPFWTCLSMNWLSFRCEYRRFLKTEAITLYNAGCKVIGRKFATSAGSPFLKISVVKLFDQQDGIEPVFQHSDTIFCNTVRMYGHRFAIKIEIMSNGQGLALPLLFFTALVISAYVGSCRSNGIEGSTSFGIQSGMLNFLLFIIIIIIIIIIMNFYNSPVSNTRSGLELWKMNWEGQQYSRSWGVGGGGLGGGVTMEWTGELGG